MKILLSFLLVLTLSVKADFFGDIGDWFEGRLTVVATNSGALDATTSPPRTRYPRMNGVTVPNATHGNASGSVERKG
jgi:hypothetical protein